MNAIAARTSLDDVRHHGARPDREPLRLLGEHSARVRQAALPPPSPATP